MPTKARADARFAILLSLVGCSGYGSHREAQQMTSQGRYVAAYYAAARAARDNPAAYAAMLPDACAAALRKQEELIAGLQDGSLSEEIRLREEASSWPCGKDLGRAVPQLQAELAQATRLLHALERQADSLPSETISKLAELSRRLRATFPAPIAALRLKLAQVITREAAQESEAYLKALRPTAPERCQPLRRASDVRVKEKLELLRKLSDSIDKDPKLKVDYEQLIASSTVVNNLGRAIAQIGKNYGTARELLAEVLRDLASAKENWLRAEYEGCLAQVQDGLAGGLGTAAELLEKKEPGKAILKYREAEVQAATEDARRILAARRQQVATSLFREYLCVAEANERPLPLATQFMVEILKELNKHRLPTPITIGVASGDQPSMNSPFRVAVKGRTLPAVVDVALREQLPGRVNGGVVVENEQEGRPRSYYDATLNLSYDQPDTEPECRDTERSWKWVRDVQWVPNPAYQRLNDELMQIEASVQAAEKKRRELQVLFERLQSRLAGAQSAEDSFRQESEEGRSAVNAQREEEAKQRRVYEEQRRRLQSLRSQRDEVLREPETAERNERAERLAAQIQEAQELMDRAETEARKAEQSAAVAEHRARVREQEQLKAQADRLKLKPSVDQAQRELTAAEETYKLVDTQLRSKKSARDAVPQQQKQLDVVEERQPGKHCTTRLKGVLEGALTIDGFKNDFLIRNEKISSHSAYDVFAPKEQLQKEGPPVRLPGVDGGLVLARLKNEVEQSLTTELLQSVARHFGQLAEFYLKAARSLDKAPPKKLRTLLMASRLSKQLSPADERLLREELIRMGYDPVTHEVHLEHLRFGLFGKELRCR